MLYLLVFNNGDESEYPDTLPLGSTPELAMPLLSNDSLLSISGFGDMGGGFFHPGHDFACDDIMPLYAIHAAYIVNVTPYFNTVASTYQVNVQFRLNDEWQYIFAFEPCTMIEAQSPWQLGNISVTIGQRVEPGQFVGNLLPLNSSAHLHLLVSHNNQAVCPYSYLNATARGIFDSWWSFCGSGVICN